MPSVQDPHYHDKVMSSDPNTLNYRELAYYRSVKEAQKHHEQQEYVEKLEKEVEQLKSGL